MNVHIVRTCNQFLVVGAVLAFSAPVSAQTMRERPRIDPNLYTQPKAAEKAPAVGSVVERRRFDPALAVRPLPVEPCDLVTRGELQAILRRNDTERVIIDMPRAPGWQQDRKKVGCSYGVIHEKRIIMDEGYDNTVVIEVDFDDPYAKQGKLIVDRPVIYGYPMALEIVNGLGDEALFLVDVSRARLEERYKGTAGAHPGPFYRNNDFLLVRHNKLVLKFQVTRTVAGNIGSGNLIQIARRALARLNEASGA